MESRHLSRREAIQVLGGSVLMGTLFGWGCGQDPLSQDHSDDLTTAPRDPTDRPLPLVLFVPGFTSFAGAVFNSVTIENYFASQRNDPLLSSDHDIRYMNDEPDFDSGRTAIKGNADAIARVLRELQNCESPPRVTIVSHSKGGQDVLHALVMLDNEANLPYRGGGMAPGRPVRQDLWHTVAGWVAFTSNHFESEFPIEGAGGGGIPSYCFSLPSIDFDPPDACPPDDCGSAYTGFPVASGNERQQYMRDHQTAIERLMKCVPTISAYGTYVPNATFNSGALNVFNRCIRIDARATDRCGANDGLVPARAGQLPGAMIRELETDPNTVGLGGGKKCGVDHFAPAVDVTLKVNRFWEADFRNEQTRCYINEVESATPECAVNIDIKPGSDPNSINCHNPKGVIAVAILSTDTFDATTVDHTTVTFAGASETHVDKRTGLARRHEEDVMGDGRPDLVLHFRFGDTCLTCESSEATLVGETFDGLPIVGRGHVRMVGANTR